MLSNYIVNQNFYDSLDGVEKTIVFSTISEEIRILKKDLWEEIKLDDYKNLTQEELNDLKAAKIIRDKNINEIDIVLNENKVYKNEMDEYYYVIQPSASCQFGCHYCGQVHSPDKLCIEHQEKTLNRIKKKLQNTIYKKLSICWFGGEPLTGIDVIQNMSKDLIQYCDNKGIEYKSKMVTNGLLLKKDLAFNLFEKFRIKRFEITLDGDKFFHDKRRHTKTGQSTFDIIYKNILDICTYKTDDLKIVIRCNVDDRNKEGIIPLLERLKNDDLHQKLNIYFAPLHSWGNDAHKLASDKLNFATMEIEWMSVMISMGFSLSLLPKRKKNLCIAVNPNSELIDPKGNVFSCSEVSLVPTYEENGKNKFSLGNINEKIDDEKRKILSDFYDDGVFEKFSCSSCSIFPVCGGGCPKIWKEKIVACPPIKINLPQRLLMYYARKRLEKNAN